MALYQILILSLLVFLPCELNAAKDGCPTNSVRHKNKCYTINHLRRTFYTANDGCIGGTLASIPSKEVVDKLREAYHSYKNAWIGLINQENQKSNRYIWWNGEKVEFLPWNSGHIGNENRCVRVDLTAKSPKIDVVNCRSRLVSLCETSLGDEAVQTDETKQADIVALDCDKGWKETPQFCYRHFTALSTWQEAQTECEKLNAHLFSVHNDKDQALLQDMPGQKTTFVWIGLHKTGRDAAYEWSDSSPFDFSKWDHNPTVAVKQCAQSGQITKGWSGNDCAKKQEYVCQKSRFSSPRKTTPEPTTTAATSPPTTTAANTPSTTTEATTPPTTTETPSPTTTETPASTTATPTTTEETPTTAATTQTPSIATTIPTASTMTTSSITSTEATTPTEEIPSTKTPLPAYLPTTPTRTNPKHAPIGPDEDYRTTTEEDETTPASEEAIKRSQREYVYTSNNHAQTGGVLSTWGIVGIVCACLVLLVVALILLVFVTRRRTRKDREEREKLAAVRFDNDLNRDGGQVITCLGYDNDIYATEAQNVVSNQLSGDSCGKGSHHDPDSAGRAENPYEDGTPGSHVAGLQDTQSATGNVNPCVDDLHVAVTDDQDDEEAIYAVPKDFDPQSENADQNATTETSSVSERAVLRSGMGFENAMFDIVQD